MSDKKRFIVVACDILHNELMVCVEKSTSSLELVLVEQELHNVGYIKMTRELQAKLDGLDTEGFDAILMGYGLCSNGICNLVSNIPIVIPKAHDCITLFMGSKETYKDYFQKNPGTMYATSNWLEVDKELGGSHLFFNEEEYQKLVEKYGKEDADYVMESMGGFVDEYSKYTFINTGAGNVDEARETARQKASDLGWQFEEMQGDTGLLQRMLDGEWSEEEFLIVQPGCTISPSYDDDVIKAVPSKLQD